MPASPPPDRKAIAFEHPLKRSVKRRGNYTREQVIVGLLGTLLAHIWMFYMLSLGLLKTEAPKQEDKYREFSIELAAPEAPEEEQIYTQTNPDVAENEPDETNRFAARDQQAANEEKPEEIDPDNRPAVESDDVFESDDIIDGEFDESMEAFVGDFDSEEDGMDSRNDLFQAASQSSSPSSASADGTLALRNQEPLGGGIEKGEADDSGIVDYDYSQVEEIPTNVTDSIVGVEAVGDGGNEDQLDHPSFGVIGEELLDNLPSPRPRRQLPRIRDYVTQDSSAGVKAIGTIAVDARGRELGEYAERMFEIVSLYWDDLWRRNNVLIPRSIVKIEFTLTKEGLVKDLQIVEGTEAKALAIYMCRESILSAAPFAPWPDGLINAYGDEKVVGIEFYYYE